MPFSQSASDELGKGNLSGPWESKSKKLLTWGITINVTFHHLTDKVTKGGVGRT